MAILFPSDPATGETFTAVGKTWTWNGAQWEGVPAVVSSGIPSGENADRPENPAVGDQFYNGTLGVLEIYTSSGWLPATGANDFNVVLNGEDTSVTLDKEYFAGAYTITSALSDTSFDIYLFDTQGNSVGYTKSPSINATSNFNKIVVLGGQDGDLLSFSYKTTFTTASITDEVTAGPVIKSISVADLPNIDDTTVITGINFAEDVQVTFTGTDQVALSAKSIVRSSATSLVVTRPDNLIEDYSPYTVTVTNPGVTAPTGTGGHISTNAITAGADPVWSTPAGLVFQKTDLTSPLSFFVAATDTDSSVNYSLTSGALPPGLSLDSSTGEISGVATSAGNYTFGITVTDFGNNTSAEREFSATLGDPFSGGTYVEADGYAYRYFTGNATLTSSFDLEVEALVVAGGGGGGETIGGGGGAGGLLGQSISITSGSYAITVGAGGAGRDLSGYVSGLNGEDSSIGSLLTATGGGGGGGYNNAPGNGGSGGGDGGANSPIAGGTGIPGQGNDGGSNATSNNAGAGGGGAATAGQSPANRTGGSGGSGSSLFSSWGVATGQGHNVSAVYYFAGGGGGGIRDNQQDYDNVGPGGYGGGGNGGRTTVGAPGLSNTGGGGGGGGYTNDRAGGNGGSGIVIIRYAL